MTKAPASLRSFALLLTALVLTTTGCNSNAETSKAATSSESSAPNTSAEPTDTAESESVASEPAILTGLKPKDEASQVVSGIVSWEVQTGKGMDSALGKKIGESADAFIDEHLLRPDRFQGKYYVKTGEMDDVKQKYTPKMFDLTKAPIDWFDAMQDKHGTNPEDWPKKARDQRADKIRSIGGLFVTISLADGGKGPIRNEMKRKVVYLGDDGDIMAYVEVTGRRANNTGGTKSITAKLTFKQVDGRWLVSGVYWTLD